MGLSFELLSHLLEANPMCISLSARNAGGRTLIDLTQKEKSLQQYLSEHKASVDNVWMPLLETHVESYSLLIPDICKLVRQYLDGSGCRW
jgi:hypothetical protein